MLAWRGCIINCLHYMACNLYYISTARRYITIPFCNGQMHILALWILNSMTPFWCLNYYFQVFTTPIRHTKEFNPSPSASLGYWNLKLVVYFLCSHKHRKRNLFLSQASQLESCTLLRIRHDIVLSAGETHESMSPCRNLLLLVFDCALGMLFCLPMLLLTKYAFCLLSWHNFVHASILHMHSRVIRTWKITWPVCPYLTPLPLNLNCTPLSVKNTYPPVNVIYPPSQCNVYPLSM